MKSTANSPEEYIQLLPKDRQNVFSRIRENINKGIPGGFQEQMSYGMLGWVVPHSLYPDGYHCDPKLPLPSINLASQKNFIALYHSGIYANKGLYDWFVSEYPKHCKRKLDMGKSCVRFKYMDDIPFDLIEELCSKLSSDEWISMYERTIKNK